MKKNNLILLGVLVVLIILFLISRTRDHVEQRDLFFDVDSTQVAGIRLSNVTDTLRLSLNNGKWMLMEPIEFPANEHSINGFFDRVLAVDTSSMPVSESQEAQEDYNVTDSLGTRVTLFDASGKTIADVIIGKSDNYNFSYGRVIDKDAIYQLGLNITHNLITTAERWRKKDIIDLEKDDIAQLFISYKQNSYNLAKSDTVWIYNDSEGSFNVGLKNKQLNKILTGLTALRTGTFVDNQYETFEELFEKPELTVTIEKLNGVKILLTFIEKPEGKNEFFVRKNNETVTLYTVAGSMLDRFTKGPQHFEKE
ncbi:MAG: DUF4340 domain-containing protein [Candidatus Cloacimonetes bacterium]|nr:DUF4340 domain-containing protein [Candidatus Cloacimonadota bacterium]